MRVNSFEQMHPCDGLIVPLKLVNVDHMLLQVTGTTKC